MKIQVWSFEQAVGRMNKALFVYRMNQHKPSVREEVKERHVQDIIRAALLLAEWAEYDDVH